MIEKEAMYKITYGLFVITTTDGAKQNGCIVNTVSMITDNPKRIVVFVNKANYTEELLRKTGVFNVSVLTEATPFETFKQFGFCSGRDTDKFAGKEYPKTELKYLFVVSAMEFGEQGKNIIKRRLPKLSVSLKRLSIWI